MNIKDIEFNGVTTFWSLCDETPLEALREGLESIGRADLVPEGIEGGDALKRALNSVFRNRNTLVRPLEGMRGAYAVVLEDAASMGDEKMRYEEAFKVACIDGDLVFNPDDSEHKFMVEREFQEQKKVVPAARLGSVLTKAVVSLHGIPVRPKGGMYWISDEHLEAWHKVCDVISAANGRNRVLGMRTTSEGGTLDAVCFSLTTKVEKMLEGLKDDLEHGDLGKRGLASRERQAQELDSFIQKYEGILGRSLQDLRDRAQEAESAAAVALLAAMGG